MKILITGFEPFGGEKINPSWEAVKMLPEEMGGALIIKKEIPTVFGKCEEAACEAIAKHRPDAVICVGQAGRRTGISLEKVGINLMEAPIPDNDGNQPVEKKIKEDGPDGLFSTLPVKTMVRNIKREGIPAEMSYTAGTYVCNNLLYSLLYLSYTKYKGMKVGFIHVPFSCEQAEAKGPETFGMPIETMARALELAIRALVEPDEGCIIAMGETH